MRGNAACILHYKYGSDACNTRKPVVSSFPVEERVTLTLSVNSPFNHVQNEEKQHLFWNFD